MLRLPSTNSRIWSIVSRSMFCMVIFIHPQHCTLFHRSRSGSFRIRNDLPVQARPALETNHRFRLIPNWIILKLALPFGGQYYGSLGSRLEAYFLIASDCFTHHRADEALEFFQECLRIEPRLG